MLTPFLEGKNKSQPLEKLPQLLKLLLINHLWALCIPAGRIPFIFYLPRQLWLCVLWSGKAGDSPALILVEVIGLSLTEFDQHRAVLVQRARAWNALDAQGVKKLLVRAEENATTAPGWIAHSGVPCGTG